MTTAIIYPSSTKWGAGNTRCFICGDRFTYNYDEKTIPAVRAPGACNKGCLSAPSAHRGDCAALGGDLCPMCVAQAGNGIENLRHSVQIRIKSLLGTIGNLLPYLTAEWEIHADIKAASACPDCGSQMLCVPGESATCPGCGLTVGALASREGASQ
ncbi:hypothetical protein [Sphaerisporangium sp. TRM90804]|uniref:hypothetical protein n=1 Tax=Sphaerisporangium sp. TRM90804 TaxID=3031113 RepID=UPI00244B3D10|nr:hypothetical protein [Sphaerisporangium sp. TRM90804]MDH2429340.1 hypothetical protein [Sphaerisporangium sp. TRM90804]